ncbi:hypothetical protein OB920_19010 [Halobacteria archaeon HArc-gm2]|nr:hypothetical protein [Halobacteria archaeon HArc-gm2]
MTRRGVAVVLAVVGVVAIVGTVAVVAGLGLWPVGAGSPLGDDPQPPALLSFESAGAHCTDDFSANSSTSVASGGVNTEITHARNVSLPGPSYAIGGPTFERQNESTYVLSVPIEETDKAPRECPGAARYEATMRVPAGDDPWRIVVTHDEETVTTIEGDSERGVASGSASVSQSVSDEQTNETEARA